MKNVDKDRVQLQCQLDAAKTSAERNKLGQFATPPLLASMIAKSTQDYHRADVPVRFLDPAFGTGSFYEAIRQAYCKDIVKQAIGVEIDPHYGEPAKAFWEETPLDLILADFTKLSAPDDSEKPNVLICNPPYTRHHHLDPREKERLGKVVKEVIGIKLSGLAELHCYFMLLSHRWLAPNGLGCWLIPGEFMDVNYGKAVKMYLLDNVRLLRIHRFDPTDVRFDDALVSSVVVWFRYEAPRPSNTIEFTYGSTLDAPQKTNIFLQKELNSQTKWSRLFLDPPHPGVHPYHAKPSHNRDVKLSDIFHIKRGIATGANKFFILNREQIEHYKLPSAFFVPILPSPRYLKQAQILADDDGIPLLEKPLFLLNCRLSEAEVQANHPTLWTYLQEGRRQDIDQRYLCRHRSPWYRQEFREPPPILCTYMGRNQNPFKFIHNQSSAIAPNVYLMLYPKPEIQRQIQVEPALMTNIWLTLKGLKTEDLVSEGRVYGGGLFKMEPRELGNVLLTGVDGLLPKVKPNPSIQLALL